MSSTPIQPGRTDAATKAFGDTTTSASGSSGSSGAIFQALLDNLAQSAQRLERSQDEVTDAASLAGAVEDARSTLTDALKLKDQLLEAYRQRRAQGA